jgi:hypothetical protein
LVTWPELLYLSILYRGIVLSPKPGGSSGYTKSKNWKNKHIRESGILSSKKVDWVRKRHALDATRSLTKISDHARSTQNTNLTSFESFTLTNKVDDGVMKIFFKFMEEFKAIKQHLCVIDEKI